MVILTCGAALARVAVLNVYFRGQEVDLSEDWDDYDEDNDAPVGVYVTWTTRPFPWLVCVVLPCP